MTEVCKGRKEREESGVMRTWKVGTKKGWGAVWEMTERGECRVTEAGLAAEWCSLSVVGSVVFS